ncbi:MAG: ATP-binding protein, partial [Candidatus Buchananbacteria bacterium]
IRAKVILLFVILSLIGTGIIFVFVNYFLRGIMAETIGSYNILLAKESIGAIDRIIYRRLERWDSYSKSNPDLVEAIKISNQEFEKLKDIDQYIKAIDSQWTAARKTEVTPFMKTLIDSKLSDGLRARTKFYNDKYGYLIFPEFFVTNKYGANVAQTGKTTDYYQADEDWWQKTKSDGLYVSDVKYDESTESYSLDLGIRVNDENGEFIGAIKSVYDIKDIFEIIDELRGQANAYLLTTDNKLIYSIDNGSGNLVDAGVILAPFLISDKNTPEHYIGSQSGVSKLFSHTHSYGYKDFKGLGWSIVIVRNSAEVLAPLNRLVYYNIFAVILILALIFILGIFISNIIIKPIKKLGNDISIVKKGDLNHLITSKSKDEIGDLTRSFALMVQAVKQSQADIETKVNEQTREIASKAKDLEDQKKAILNVLEDVEEEKTKTESLAKDLEKFKMAVDNASDHIVITDPDGIILYANQSVEEITGYPVKEIIGQKAGSKENWGGLMNANVYKNFWDTIKKKKKVYIGELNNRRKNGQDYEVIASVSPVLDAKGEVLFFIGIERDITKEKQIDKAKTEFVSLASHQLRTPLSAINWYAEMLLAGDAGKISKEQKKYLAEIYRGNQRMVDLVNALLNVSRIDLGTFAIEPVPTDIIELAKSVVGELQPQIKIKKLKLGEDFAKDLPTMMVDPKLIRIIFQNLLSNSVKYTPEKGQIDFMIKKDKNSILVTVRDNGYGITKSQQNKIFEKLFRADNVREKDTEGTGLGLYIVKAIVDQAKGKIWFESEENKGTTFYVSLPLAGMPKKEGTKELS